jgi:hypothetical protein
MDYVKKTTNALTDALSDVTDVAKSLPSSAKTTLTTGSGRMTAVYSLVGLGGATLVGAGLTRLPFQVLPMGNTLRTITTFGVGAGLVGYGSKKGGDIGTASLVSGAILFGAGAAQMLGYVGLFPSLQRIMTKEAEESLEGYVPMDSVTVDLSSNQPAQNYGAEGEASPEVQIASSMESDPMDSVRQEAAMGHGVTQWFGSEHFSSSTPFRDAPSMEAFAASTDVGGNRRQTGDSSMANVVGGTSMKDVPATSSTAYDVSMEMDMSPKMTAEVGGVQDVFSTYILPSYENPSAGDSGRGVTEWYAESNQTGFLGRFMAGAEGHGSVIGQ